MLGGQGRLCASCISQPVNEGIAARPTRGQVLPSSAELCVRFLESNPSPWYHPLDMSVLGYHLQVFYKSSTSLLSCCKLDVAPLTLDPPATKNQTCTASARSISQRRCWLQMEARKASAFNSCLPSCPGMTLYKNHPNQKHPIAIACAETASQRQT